MRKQIGRSILTAGFATSLLWLFGSAYAQEDQPKPEPKAAAASSQAQTRPVSVYRYEFVVRELEDGKQINSRQYTLSGKSFDWARLRVGSRIPIMTGVGNQFQYHDVGINIDCRLDEGERGPMLYTSFESSSVVAGAGSSTPPVVRQVKSQGDSLVVLAKPMIITTLDDVGTNRRYEIEVTVTKVK